MVKDTRENALINKTSDLINNESVIVEVFNQNYENIVENLPEKASNGLGDPLNADSDKTTVLELIKKYLNDLCIVKIKNFFFDIGLFDFPEQRTEDLTAITRPLNPNEATKNIIDMYLRS